MKSKVLTLAGAFVCLTTAGRSQAPITMSDVFKSLRKVAVAGDGVMYAVTDDDKIQAWTGKEWVQLDGELMDISVGSKNEIWGVNRSNQVWKGSASGWERKPGLMRKVAVEKGSGGTVVAIDLNSRPVIWNGIGCTLLRNPVEPAPNLVQIAIGRRDQIYGTGTGDEIYRWVPNANPSLSKWVKVKGNLKSISVGTDGSIGGVNSENQGLVRQDSDVQAELSNPAAQPKWNQADAPVTGMYVIDSETSMILDAKGYIAQYGTPWAESKWVDHVLILPDSTLTVKFYEPELKVVYDQPGMITPLIVGGCVKLSGTLKLDIPPDPDHEPDVLERLIVPVSCPVWTGTTKASIPQSPKGARSVGVGAWFNFACIGVTVTSSDDPCWNNASSSTGSLQTAPAAVGNTQDAISGFGAGAYSWVARGRKSMMPDGSLACQPKIYRSVSNHSWVEFQMPVAPPFSALLIPPGAYNNYVFPACNRVWWDTLVFTCMPETGWQLLAGRYDADALCHGSPGNSPNVEYGNR